MQMIGAIQSQDVLKRRLQAIVHCFDKISEVVRITTKDMANTDNNSPERLDSIVDDRLGEMVRFAADELRNDREPAVGQSDVQRQSVAVELF
jgi:methyl-accepting chemotaxis protein